MSLLFGKYRNRKVKLSSAEFSMLKATFLSDMNTKAHFFHWDAV